MDPLIIKWFSNLGTAPQSFAGTFPSRGGFGLGFGSRFVGVPATFFFRGAFPWKPMDLHDVHASVDTWKPWGSPSLVIDHPRNSKKLH